MIAPGRGVRLFALLAVLAACTDPSSTEEPIVDEPAADDLGLGDISAEDMKADGNWGAALECKPVPELPKLVAPKITISIDGLTLRLTDAATGFDKVFPVGAGQIDQTETDPEYRESFSYYPIIRSGGNDFAITPSTIQPCKTWWTDPATGEKTPVFAGLPFLSFYGNYAIHGPIDKFRAPNGGSLRRGYVSHGCFRMEAADVLEVYARIKGVARVPVHVQREAERTADGEKVDVAAKWIGAECSDDSECGYTNGFCAKNPLSLRGFCSARCTRYCTDRAGNPSTFCVANPASPGQGMCVAKAQSENFECRPYDHMGAQVLPRFNQPSVTANVCAPASRGWVGDRCRADGDCTNGTSCKGATAEQPGLCTMPCTRYCADQPGAPDTFCANVSAFGAGGSCMRQCTPSSNASECPAQTTCRPVSRFSAPSTTRHVCMPD